MYSLRPGRPPSGGPDQIPEAKGAGAARVAGRLAGERAGGGHVGGADPLDLAGAAALRQAVGKGDAADAHGRGRGPQGREHLLGVVGTACRQSAAVARPAARQDAERK
jgi:hypothetical protein